MLSEDVTRLRRALVDVCAEAVMLRMERDRALEELKELALQLEQVRAELRRLNHQAHLAE